MGVQFDPDVLPVALHVLASLFVRFRISVA